MKNNVSITEERQFITKSLPIPWQAPCRHRICDFTIQFNMDWLGWRRLYEGESLGETAYLDRMIHFWRKVSLAGLARSGRGLDDK
jgi:hypothetical protein